MFGVSGNYATALYLASVKANALEKVESELLEFVEASKGSCRFFQFIKDLSVPEDTRIKALKEISAEAKFSDITRNFLLIAMRSLKESLRVLDRIGWNGDPCAPRSIHV